MNLFIFDIEEESSRLMIVTKRYSKGAGTNGMA